MNKNVLLGIVVAAVAAYFLFFRKKKEETVKTQEEIIREAQANTNVKYAQSISENVEVVEVDKETEEYNNAINQYKRLSGGYAPPKGLTTKQILSLCEDMEAKAQALADYVTIAGKDDIQDEDMTIEQIQNEITSVVTEKTNNVRTLINNIGTVTLTSGAAISAARIAYDQLNEELRSKIENYSVLTAAESRLKQLQQQKAAADAEAARKAQQKATWTQRSAAINTIVTNFKKTVEDNGSALSQKPWDQNALNAMKSLKTNEKVYANWYFANKLKGATVSKNYGSTKYKATTVYAAITDGNTTSWRAGQALAKEVKALYKTISGSVNEYGEVVK